MQQYVCIDLENIFDYTKLFESDGDMKNMFCSNFHFKLKRNQIKKLMTYMIYSTHLTKNKN